MARENYGKAKKFFREQVLTYTGDDCLIWPFSRRKDGYGEMNVGRSGVPVGRVVCEIKHGPPPSPIHEAAHSCGNGAGGCVSPSHIRWKTKAENAAERVAHGGQAQGESHGHSKLTDEDVTSILRLRGAVPQRKLAANFGVSSGTICAIFAGRTWRHIPRGVAA